ncbi:pirin family protein [Lysobacter sp. TY2-98]|uniref:pirin family protein n=1 Tax=Lysobacter sp. TY2-98 TaxID=2290922 RepID=UPI000E1FF27B|nr:pirin family protein [Lysobacter sp. TY2-98]AXK72656.1 pirin family protein [Lysobacter sp. TY2-98]
MIIERPGDSRGHAQHGGWLDSHHTFSFGSYYDPQWMGFGPLRVINEDRVAGGGGFPPHGHANMEILSIVLDGQLAHQDSAGGGGTIGPGEVQWMSAGHGVQHSEFNASKTDAVHFLQIWIQPDRVNAPPAYAQRAPQPGDDSGDWVLLASPDGADGSIAIRQDARLQRAALAPGANLHRALDSDRRYWLQVARGTVMAADHVLRAGDALGFVEEGGPLVIEANGDAEVLLFDLPH